MQDRLLAYQAAYHGLSSASIMVSSRYAFSQRTINEWNRFPRDRVKATSVNTFKNTIDNILKDLGMFICAT